MFVTSKMSNNMHNMLQTTEEVTSDLQVSQVSVTQPTQTGLNRHNPGGGGGGWNRVWSDTNTYTK